MLKTLFFCVVLFFIQINTIIMKKAILFLVLVFLGQEGYTQFLPSGNSNKQLKF